MVGDTQTAENAPAVTVELVVRLPVQNVNQSLDSPGTAPGAFQRHCRQLAAAPGSCLPQLRHHLQHSIIQNITTITVDHNYYFGTYAIITTLLLAGVIQNVIQNWKCVT